MAFPEEMNTEEFYTTVVPDQIEKHRRWAERLHGIMLSIDAAAYGPTAPVVRLAASRFLDAALRGRVPDESQALSLAFMRWCEQTQSMLCYEWRRHLDSLADIDVADIFTRHTVFHTWIDEDEDTTRRLLTAPFTVFDRSHSAALFDPDRGILLVEDPTDHAGVFDIPTEPGAAAASLDELANRPGATEQDFEEALLNALRSAPGPTITSILDALVNAPAEAGVDGAGSPAATTGNDTQEMAGTVADAFESLLAEALETNAFQRKMRQATSAIAIGAIQTTRAHLRFPQNLADEQRARASLLLAVAEFLAAGGNPDHAPASLAGTGPAPPELCREALDEARRLSGGYAQRWLGKLAHDGKLGSAVADLLREPQGAQADPDPDAGPGLVRHMRAVQLARFAVEAAQIARRLEAAAATLNEAGEPVVTVLAKLGQGLKTASSPNTPEASVPGQSTSWNV